MVTGEYVYFCNFICQSLGNYPLALAIFSNVSEIFYLPVDVLSDHRCWADVAKCMKLVIVVFRLLIAIETNLHVFCKS